MAMLSVNPVDLAHLIPNFARLKNAFLVLTVLWVSTHDAVLAADISPDHGQVALGGPNKVVRV